MKLIFDRSDFDNKMKRALIAVDKGAAEALRVMARMIEEKSQVQAPKEEGDLRASMKKENQIHGPVKETIISYNTPYAAFQHEGIRRDGTHVVRNYTTPGTKKKFLEDPVKEVKGKARDIIRTEVLKF